MKKIFLFLLILFIPVISFAGEKVLVFGDSLTPFIGQNIKKKYETDIYYKISSGLINKEFYNWKEKISNINLKSYSKIFIILGTNDAGYNVNYEKISQDFIQFLKNKTNAEIYWISPPFMRKKSLNENIQKINLQIKNACNNENIHFIDVYQSTFTKNWNLKLRTSDGVHLTKKGGEEIVNYIFKEIK